MRLCGLALALLDLLLQRLSVWRPCGGGGSCATYQGSHGAVKSMSVVASELGVGTLERRVSVGLGLLDTVRVVVSVGRSHRSGCCSKGVVVGNFAAYPFLWAFLAWLCCDEFLDSVEFCQHFISMSVGMRSQLTGHCDVCM